MERRLQLGATRSVSVLAAPAVAAAALGRRRDVIFPIGRRVLLFTEITVSARSTARVTLISKPEDAGASRILASGSPVDDWNWGPEDHRLEAGDRLAIVGTRAGLARVLRATKAPTEATKT